MQQIIRHLFKAESLDDVPIQRLEELVAEHPAFSLGHYLLSRKLGSEQADRFSEETQRTNLYFTNAFWLHWLLEDKAEKEWVFPAGREANGTPSGTEMADYPAEAGSSEEAITHVPVEEQHFQEALGAADETPIVADEVTAVEEAPPWEEPVAVASEPETPAEAKAPEAAKEEAPEEPLVFQSYHTIDYFASQGIRLSSEESLNPSDRLGRQLKSFTEWLKVMKKLPQKEGGQKAANFGPNIVPDIVGEQRIQAIAAHSIEEREVVTETMAEVLAKQGMWDKAADVYQKLSLLNPDKSAYFATLVGHMRARSKEQLNTN